jgi:hypothetical protein
VENEKFVEMFKEIFNYVNHLNYDKHFISKAVENQHRTLQQSFMGDVINFIKDYAKTQYFDGRNEDSVRFAKAFVKWLEENPGIEYLPFI